MTIGVLTFYRVANFGANLQAISTYYYLIKHGHTPIFIQYKSKESLLKMEKSKNDIQFQNHIKTVDNYIKNQTPVCSSEVDLRKFIEEYHIEAMIIGSDAVLQHHPLLSRIKIGKRKPITIKRSFLEMTYPNLFWGAGFSNKIPSALMSVSSQNSMYKWYSYLLKKRMRHSLSNMKYISVRDTWTQDMIMSICEEEVPVTPDPVFAFNNNAIELIPLKDNIKDRFGLPDKYVLVSLRSQSLSLETLDAIKKLFKERNISCVALTMPGGIKFDHNFDYEIAPPLSPLDWYALLKYADGYVGSNMHPIVVCLHNAVPCVSIDNWGRTNFFNKKISDGSSKVEHIMNEFGVGYNHYMISYMQCKVSANDIVKRITDFPIKKVQDHALMMVERYQSMMENILKSLKQKE